MDVPTWVRLELDQTFHLVTLAIAALISFIALLFTRETRGIDLLEIDRLDNERRAGERAARAAG